MWDYYEYGDDLIARKNPMATGGKHFEIWVGGKWVPCWDHLKFAYTAQKIDDVREYLEAYPQYQAAFDNSVEKRVERLVASGQSGQSAS